MIAIYVLLLLLLVCRTQSIDDEDDDDKFVGQAAFFRVMNKVCMKNSLKVKDIDHKHSC